MKHETHRTDARNISQEEIKDFLKIALDIMLDKSEGLLIIMKKDSNADNSIITMQGISQAKGLNEHLIIHTFLDSVGISLKDAVLHEMADNN